ncbi:MerR family transcriptional regulator [Micromonospora radicis]|uniref:MerR family transcriptional regulator n=1 Tax=Micromonospora radicis TaxID=1894971 RepID=A0A418MYL8_9ACTN|nr:MerR family transcriptional regulator [Micromonospora radicis]RIV40268.1 MerR family transcriptional regulator [Micromonospora radicis]
MRISDLSRRTGVPVATIKFYLREGLLPPGRPTGRNQAQYGEAHCRRLLFIRAMTGIGQLDLSTVLELLAAIEDGELSLPGLYQRTNRVVYPDLDSSKAIDDVAAERDEVDRFIDERGWRVGPDVPGRNRLAQVLAALRQLGCDCQVDFFQPYAQLAEEYAERELSLLPRDEEIERAAAVARAVLLDVALAALRGIAQEHLVNQRFGDTAPPSGTVEPIPPISPRRPSTGAANGGHAARNAGPPVEVPRRPRRIR